MAAVDASRGKSVIQEAVNGFRIYGFEAEAANRVVGQEECVSERFEEMVVFAPTYLPPGTSAVTPQYAGICADGSIAWVFQEFFFRYGTFSIGYELGERAVGTEAAPGRIEAATIAGRPAVIIRPIIDEGNGQSIVAYQMDRGFIVVGAENLPLHETLKIAEAIKCVRC